MAPSSANALLQWGVAAACSAFFWALASVASRVSPTNFETLVRGVVAGGVQTFTTYSTSFHLVTPTVDWLILLVCSASVLAVLALRIPGLGYVRMAALMLPALLLALYTFSPFVLLSIGALGTVAGILYLVLHSSELLGSPGKMLSLFLVLLAASTAVVFSVSTARWVLNALDGAPSLKGWTWWPSMLGLKLLNQPYSLMPGLVLLLFLSWPIRLLLGAFRKGLRERFAGLSSRFGGAGNRGDGWLNRSASRSCWRRVWRGRSSWAPTPTCTRSTRRPGRRLRRQDRMVPLRAPHAHPEFSRCGRLRPQERPRRVPSPPVLLGPADRLGRSCLGSPPLSSRCC